MRQEEVNKVNVSKLKAKIVEKNLRAVDIAKMLNVDISTYYRKLQGLAKFNIEEASMLKTKLGLSDEEASEIFFRI